MIHQLKNPLALNVVADEHNGMFLFKIKSLDKFREDYGMASIIHHTPNHIQSYGFDMVDIGQYDTSCKLQREKIKGGEGDIKLLSPRRSGRKK